jgi:hypothetical protein
VSRTQNFLLAKKLRKLNLPKNKEFLMKDLEKNDCHCGKDCDCEGHEHDHQDAEEQEIDTYEGEEETNVIQLEMDDGTMQDFILLGTLEHNGKQYVALAEVDSNEYDILAWEMEDDFVNLNVIEDDNEFNEVADLFHEYLQGDFEEEEDED